MCIPPDHLNVALTVHIPVSFYTLLSLPVSPSSVLTDFRQPSSPPACRSFVLKFRVAATSAKHTEGRMQALNKAVQAVKILSSVCLGSIRPEDAAKGLMDAAKIVIQVWRGRGDANLDAVVG